MENKIQLTELKSLMPGGSFEDIRNELKRNYLLKKDMPQIRVQSISEIQKLQNDFTQISVIIKEVHCFLLYEKDESKQELINEIQNYLYIICQDLKVFLNS